jgi:hypothetical protein
MGRGAGFKSDTTRHLSGRSVRVLASGLAFVLVASPMTTRERVAGKCLEELQGGFAVAELGRGKSKSDTAI